MNGDFGMECNCGAADCSERLAQRLRAFVTDRLVQLEDALVTDLNLPSAEAGHLVRDSARVDLAHVAALLIEHGVESVGATSLRQLVWSTLRTLDGAGVDGFFSYRLAETARLLGGLEALPTPIADVVVEGSSSTRLFRRIAAREPVRNNFLVVAARCDHERRTLGLDGVGFDVALGESVAAIFERGGWISDDPRWPDNFDIYTPEMYLLSEPFADTVGSGWKTGLDRVLEDLDALCSPRGVVIWGRSIGVLAEAMTIEVAALAASRGHPATPIWLGRASETLSGLAGWFDRGLLVAHRQRTSDAYRGPSRRFQMTFDVLGKLLEAARWLGAAGHAPVEMRSSHLWAEVDRYVAFGYGDAGAWAYRSRSLSFVIPVVGGPTAEYGVAPRWPGVFEQPPAGPPAFLPTVLVPDAGNQDENLLPVGTGSSVLHRPGELTVTSQGWRRPDGAVLGGGRIAKFAVRDGLLVTDEVVNVPGAATTPPVSMMLASGYERPVLGAVDDRARFFTSPVEGVAEWQTPWGAYDLVSHVTGESARPFTWSVGRGIVVASSDIDHPYNRALYEHLPQHVRVVDAGRPDNLAARLDGVDVLHLAWPERWVGRVPADHERVLRLLRESGVRVVWTMHNLVPHRDRNETGFAIYAAWAAAAHAIIHHSEYGLSRAMEHFTFAHETVHEVIPHGHWGDLVARHATLSRAEVESDEGWGTTGARLAVVGQPRAEKHLDAVIAAARACKRDDLQFIIRTVPEHHALATDGVRLEHGYLSPERYFRRFAAYDALILPFDEGYMLGSGTVFDCLGAGIAAIGSAWGFQQEILGDALITYESGHLLSLLRTLDSETTAASSRAIRDRQSQFDWVPIGSATAALFLRQCGLRPEKFNVLAGGTNLGGAV